MRLCAHCFMKRVPPAGDFCGEECIRDAHAELLLGGKLRMWTIYERPLDFPQGHVVRMFIVDKPTAAAWTAPSLDIARQLIPRGKIPLPRAPSDHPSVVETWV